MLELESAQQKILDAVQPLPAELISLNAAADRILAGKILSPVDLPPFDNSAMDGYAIRSADVAGASREHPAVLRLSGDVPAGTVGEPVLPGTCSKVMTGAPIPPGADWTS